MSDSIKISPKHGVNPTIPICFWCGKEKNEIALMGKIDRQDSEAPHHIITDYEPCDNCKEMFSKGIQVIGVVKEPLVPEMFPIVGDEKNGKLYPTGSMFVGTKDWAERFLTENDATGMIEEVMNKGILIMPDEIVCSLVEEIKQNTEIPKMDVEIPEREEMNESNSN